MGKINVLNKRVAELIAAGEVVERPCSVIKELLENSIDAGANAITVEIKNGGVSLMKVSDNGSGIFKNDIKKAFLRHATSKVLNENDLNSIKTLGFRGEALASISAVSKVELFTRTEDELEGTHYVIKGSEESIFEEMGCAKGLTILITDLFYNTPARLKFLKKDVTEANAIASVIDKLALSHPEVSFKFIRDNKEELNTPGDGKIKSCIYSVYKNEFFKGLIPVKYSLNGVNIKGYITTPGAARANRSMQHFFVNGRYVKSKTALAALEQAFKGSIMTSRFPACILYIELPYEITDVNVHPAKIEIRFINEKPIFEAVYYAVKSALRLNDKNLKTTFLNINKEQADYDDLKIVENQKVNNYSKSDNFEKQTTKDVHAILKSSNEITVNKKRTWDKPEIFIPKENAFRDAIRLNDIGNKNSIGHNPVFWGVDTKSKKTNNKDTNEYAGEKECIKNTNKSQDVFKKEEKNQNIKFISEVFSTYVIFENENELIFIDKHAAHERLLYEKLKEENTDIESQMLLEPVTVILNKNEYSAVIENKKVFAKAGFDIDDFGPGTVIVRSSPCYLENKDISFFVSEIAGYILENKKILDTEYLDWVYHNIACRGAIKAGKETKPQEIIELFNKISDNDIRNCPHGRPVYIIFKKKDIDKQFGRM